MTTLKVKLQYDFETLADLKDAFFQLKSVLYDMTRKFQASKGILSNICLCISYLAIQAQWPNFIEEIMKTFSDSLESVATAFRILKNIVQEAMNDDIVIDEGTKRDLFRRLESESSKILTFLNMWAKNVNEGKIGEGTTLVPKWKFANSVLLF